MPYLQGLNERQQEAVLAAREAAVKVLAGAGTGKTKLIVHRFAKLVAELRDMGVESPQNRILAVTFTNDAAQQLKDKTHQMLLEMGEEGLGDAASISTFHTFCLRLVKHHPAELGLGPDFTIIEPLAARLLLGRLIESIKQGSWTDLGMLLPRYGLDGVLNPHVFSLSAIQAVPMADRSDVFQRIPQVIQRIKAAGLSPLDFLQVATAQSRAFTEALKQLPLREQYSGEAFSEARNYPLAWHRHLSAWASPDWQPLAFEQDAVTPPKGSDYLKPVEFIRGALGTPKYNPKTKNYEPTDVDWMTLDVASSLEQSVIQWVCGVYVLYLEQLRQRNQVDFDGVVQGAIYLLESSPTIRQHYADQYLAKIVDEFQDSNGSELRLLQNLMNPQAPALTVVGDEKQSIYGFRFAQRENLALVFENAPPQLVHLETNYRSWPPILSVANALTRRITENSAHHHLSPNPAATGETRFPVQWLTLGIETVTTDEKGKEQRDKEAIGAIKRREARLIAIEIARLVSEEGYRFSDIMVLIKKHGKADILQQAFSALGIPMVRKKMTRFFDEPCIKDAMALLRLCANAHDDHAWCRVLQARLSHRQMRVLMNAIRPAHGSILKGLKAVLVGELSWPAELLYLQSPLKQLVEAVVILTETHQAATPLARFQEACRRIGVIYPVDAVAVRNRKLKYVKAFETMLETLQELQSQEGGGLKEIIQFILTSQGESDFPVPFVSEADTEDAVQVMTVHGAKGLEAKVVFVAYAEDKRLPQMDDSRLLFDPQFGGKPGFGLMVSTGYGLGDLKKQVYKNIWYQPRIEAEEKRLFYVALTRGMERMIVTRARQSIDWTAPDAFQEAQLEAHAEQEELGWFETRYWHVPLESLRHRLEEVLRERANQAPVLRV